jgi:hypothetical protein
MSSTCSSKTNGDAPPSLPGLEEALWASSQSVALNNASSSSIHRHPPPHATTTTTSSSSSSSPSSIASMPLPLLMEHPELEELLHYALQQKTSLQHYCRLHKVVATSTDHLPLTINRCLRLLLPSCDAHCSLDGGNDNDLDAIPDSLQTSDAYIKAMSMYNSNRVGSTRNTIIKSRQCVYVAFIQITLDGTVKGTLSTSHDGDGNSTHSSVSSSPRRHWIPYTGSTTQFDRRWLQVKRGHKKTFDLNCHMSHIRCALWGDVSRVPHCDLAIAAAILQSNRSSVNSDDARVFVLVLDALNDQFRNLEAHVMKELPSLWTKSQSGLNKKHEYCTSPCRYCDTRMIGTYPLQRSMLINGERKKKQQLKLEEKKRDGSGGTKRKAAIALEDLHSSSNHDPSLHDSSSILLTPSSSSMMSLLPAPSSSSSIVVTTLAEASTIATTTTTTTAAITNSTMTVSFDTSSDTTTTLVEQSTKPKKTRSLADDLEDLFS